MNGDEGREEGEHETEDNMTRARGRTARHGRGEKRSEGRDEPTLRTSRRGRGWTKPGIDVVVRQTRCSASAGRGSIERRAPPCLASSERSPAAAHGLFSVLSPPSPLTAPLKYHIYHLGRSPVPRTLSPNTCSFFQPLATVPLLGFCELLESTFAAGLRMPLSLGGSNPKRLCSVHMSDIRTNLGLQNTRSAVLSHHL